MTKTRFCPSPSGLIHLGNARTALFSVLLAQKNQGSFLLRIEDTDQTRSEDYFIESLCDDLKWLGLAWQEGWQQGGELGPYQQSQRVDIYEDYYQQLLKKDLAYPCFCSEQQLAVSRKLQRTAGRAPRYLGTCRGLTTKDIADKQALGLQPTLRFKMPRGESIQFVDLVKGSQNFASDDLGDFIIRRADGSAAFMYCNAIDDALMGVTVALRGEDHLTNTPRQLLILRALGLTEPSYGHIALITASDGKPLSKRNGSRSLQALAQEGYLPVAVLNYLARLGHYYENNDLLSLPCLAQQFELEQLSKSPAKYDPKQLDFWQKQAVLQLYDVALASWLTASIEGLVPETKRQDFLRLVQQNCLLPEEAVRWASILFADKLSLTAAEFTDLPSHYWDVLTDAVTQFGEDYQAVTEHLKTELDLRGKALFKPLRLIFSGVEKGPELKVLMALQGRVRLLAKVRLAQAVALGEA